MLSVAFIFYHIVRYAWLLTNYPQVLILFDLVLVVVVTSISMTLYGFPAFKEPLKVTTAFSHIACLLMSLLSDFLYKSPMVILCSLSETKTATVFRCHKSTLNRCFTSNPVCLFTASFVYHLGRSNMTTRNFRYSSYESILSNNNNTFLHKKNIIIMFICACMLSGLIKK